MSASWQGHVDVVDRLVQHGAKVDWKKEVNSYYFCRMSASVIYVATMSQLCLQQRIIIIIELLPLPKNCHIFFLINDVQHLYITSNINRMGGLH